MAVPAWFNDYVYMKNKLAQMQAVDSTYTKSKLDKAFNDAGFSGTEGHYNHFVAYGNSENVSPNDYFDVEYYFTSKAAQFFNVNINDVTTAQIDLMKEAFDRVGLSAWDHYVKYGMAEGIDPSASFSTTEYFNDKLVLMQAVDPTYDMNKLIEAFKTANLNPVQHYFSYGKAEGLVPEPASSDGSAQNLTYAADNLVGESVVSFDSDTGAITINDKFDDTFNAEVGTLQSEDKIDGLGGNDLLYARVDVDDVAAGSIEPTVTNVETVLFRSQIGSGNTANASAAVGAVIDADRITLADGENLTIGSDNSRANLAIEDVRHYSNETTVRFADADPAVNFQLYFDPQHLKAASATSTGELILKLMDVKSAQESGGEQPLLTSPYNGFKFIYNGSEEITLTFRESDKDLYTGESANYGTLLTAVERAIADYEATSGAHVGVFTVAPGTGFTSTATVDDISYTGDGTTLVLKSSSGSVTEKGWTLTGNEAPASNRYVAEITHEGSSTCPLIQTNVELDNVGRVQWDDAYPDCLPDDIIKGSNAGDLQIGSMSMRSGIERMDLTVDRGSWLSGLYSTNNTLRMVTVAADDINGDGIKGNVGDQRSQDASMADDAKNGQLYIGDWNGKLDDNGSNGNWDDGVLIDKDNLTWADPAQLLTAGKTAGLHDVAVFDAATSGYTGDINIAAEITEDSYDKYLKSVDGVKGLDKLAPVGGYDKAFTYATGSGDDVVNMTVDGDIAADNDFAMNIVTGSGDDLVAFQYTDAITTNQSVNNKYMQKVNIDLGDGDDTAWFYGAKVYDDGNGGGETEQKGGAVKISGGTGNDTIYANQIDMMIGGAGSGVTWGPDSYNAVFVLNAPSTKTATNTEGPREVGVDGLNGATLNNNIHTGSDTFTVATGVTGATGFYVSVTFKGFASEKILIGSYDATSKTALSYTAKQINDAIIKAVENDSVLSGLLSAKDGSGHSLIIESLINGKMDADTDLSIDFSLLNASKEVVQKAVVVTGADNNANWYEPQYGQKNGEDYTGNDTKVASQVVVEAGAGDDLIVLGKNGTTADGTSGVTVDFGVETPAEGDVLTVVVGGVTYTNTYDDGEWKGFVNADDPTADDLETAANVTVTEPATGETTWTFTRGTDENGKTVDFEIESASASASAAVDDSAITDPAGTYTLGIAYTNMDGAAADETMTVTVTPDDGDAITFTSTYTGTAWSTFTTPAGTTTDITVTYTPDTATAGAGTATVTSSANFTATADVTGVTAGTGGAATATPDAAGTTAELTATVDFPDLSSAVEGNTITVTVDGTAYTSTYEDDGTGTMAWSAFVDDAGTEPADPLTISLPDEDGVVTVTGDATLTGVDSASYVLPVAATAEEIENTYENSGLDIIELSGSFGNDYIVDFESGVDQVNVSGLGITKVESTGTDAGALTANEAVVATGFTAKAATGIFELSEVTKLVTDGAIAWTGSNYGSAVVLLAEDNAAGQNVYTAALVTKASASATTTATVMGSLTLASGEEIQPVDLVGVSDLMADPAYDGGNA